MCIYTLQGNINTRRRKTIINGDTRPKSSVDTLELTNIGIFTHNFLRSIYVCCSGSKVYIMATMAAIDCGPHNRRIPRTISPFIPFRHLDRRDACWRLGSSKEPRKDQVWTQIGHKKRSEERVFDYVSLGYFFVFMGFYLLVPEVSHSRFSRPWRSVSYVFRPSFSSALSFIPVSPLPADTTNHCFSDSSLF